MASLFFFFFLARNYLKEFYFNISPVVKKEKDSTAREIFNSEELNVIFAYSKMEMFNNVFQLISPNCLSSILNMHIFQCVNQMTKSGYLLFDTMIITNLLLFLRVYHHPLVYLQI